jgi:anti-anti-sigma factor
MSGVDDFGGLLKGVLTHSDGCARYTLRGELDMANADRLFSRLAGLVQVDGGHLELDLADVAFIDSTGIRTLVQLRIIAGGCGGDMLILRPSPPVVRIIRLSGLDDILPICGGVHWEDLDPESPASDGR